MRGAAGRRDLGIDPALVTCDIDNVASRKVIEANRGRLWQASDGKMRFWVPTRQADDSAANASTASESAGRTALSAREDLHAVC
jgi:hypothetical protein